MKKKLSDEKLEKMLVNMFDSEVPEDLQFSDEKRAGEMHVSVKRKVKKHGSWTLGAAACAAALIIAVPAVFRLSDRNNGSINDPEILSEQSENEIFRDDLRDFKRETADYIYICEELKDSKYYKEYFDHPFDNGPVSDMTGVFYALGLIPENTENAYLYVKTIKTPDGINVITRQAYIVWYDKKGDVSAVMKTNETVSDDEAALISRGSIFKGVKNSDSGFSVLESRFISGNSEVSYEGKIIRPLISDSGIKSRIETDRFRAYISSGGTMKPVCLYELRYQYDSELFGDAESIPETGMNIVCENGKTDYHAVIGYDSTQSISLKLNGLGSEGLWGQKELK